MLHAFSARLLSLSRVQCVRFPHVAKSCVRNSIPKCVLLKTIHVGAFCIFPKPRACGMAGRTAPTRLLSDRRNKCMPGAFHVQERGTSRARNRSACQSVKVSPSQSLAQLLGNRSVRGHSSVNASELCNHFCSIMERGRSRMQCQNFLFEEGLVGERLHSKSVRRHGLPHQAEAHSESACEHVRAGRHNETGMEDPKIRTHTHGIAHGDCVKAFKNVCTCACPCMYVLRARSN